MVERNGRQHMWDCVMVSAHMLCGVWEPIMPYNDTTPTVGGPVFSMHNKDWEMCGMPYNKRRKAKGIQAVGWLHNTYESVNKINVGGKAVTQNNIQWQNHSCAQKQNRMGNRSVGERLTDTEQLWSSVLWRAGCGNTACPVLWGVRLVRGVSTRQER